MKVGEVIVKDGKADVITEVYSTGEYETERLESFISKSNVIKIDHEYMTVDEFIKMRSEDYMNGVIVHER